MTSVGRRVVVTSMVPVRILMEDDSPCRGRRCAAAAAGVATVPCLLALFWRAALPLMRCRDYLGPSVGRRVAGGFSTCQRGNPFRLSAPVGVHGSYGAPPAWEFPGRPGTAAAGGLRRALVSPGTQGCPRCRAAAWSYGCAGLRAGAIASVVRSFHPGCRPPFA